MASITFKAIIPKKADLLNQRKLIDELIGALDKTGKAIQGDFKKTTRTWTNKPRFKKIGPRLARKDLEVEVSTTNRIYFFLTRGTRAHIIRPMRVPSLRFRTGFSPKTRVRVIGSRAGSRSGPTVFAKQVSHPGTKAREFDKEIARRRKKTLDNLMRLAFLRSIRR